MGLMLQILLKLFITWHPHSWYLSFRILQTISCWIRCAVTEIAKVFGFEFYFCLHVFEFCLFFFTISVAVVLAFFLCWAPFHAQRMVALYGDNQLFIYAVTTYVSGILYYLSTCINPLLYNIMSNKFREAFKVCKLDECLFKSINALFPLIHCGSLLNAQSFGKYGQFRIMEGKKLENCTLNFHVMFVWAFFSLSKTPTIAFALV